LIVSLIFCFVIVNACFAGLYLLEPGSIAHAAPRSFADAFSFSVQTFSTIGFGTLAPQTEYANFIETLEAATGLLGVALATGLMFAKASRPSSSALFSNVMVLSEREQIPTLMFRLGNTRGNDVVDAQISVSVLKEELTSEGHHMRRLHPLKLVRERTPLFVMTWTVMHEVNEESPIYGVDFTEPQPGIVAFVVTMTGHDGTYQQTIYARQMYYSEDVRVGQRFVDVIRQMPNGAMLVDYSKFHDTIADADAISEHKRQLAASAPPPKTTPPASA
jgi:inward rectifier potassium channel